MELQELKIKYSKEIFREDFPQWQEGKNVNCAFHDDKTPSMSITKGDSGEYFFNCFGCNKKGDVITYLEFRDNITNAEAIKCFKDRFNGNAKKEIVKTYSYHDENRNTLYEIVRLKPKSFRQRRPDGKSDWIWNMKDVRRVLYRLPEIIKADTVFVVEGEKDADNLASLGLTATTNVGGVGKWKPEYNKYLKGKAVVILPDNDESGKAHAHKVVSELKGIARSVKVIELPGLPEKGDVSDWLKAGGTKERLLELVEKVEEWEDNKSEIKSNVTEEKDEPETCSIDSIIFPSCPFPDQAIPGRLREFCYRVADSFNVEKETVFTNALTILSSAIGNSIRVHVNDQWVQPVFLWSVIVGNSGEGKSDPLNFLLKHLQKLQGIDYKNWKEELKEYDKKLKVYKSDRKGLIDEPEKPVLKHYYTQDATIEALYKIFSDTPRGLILYCDELSTMIKGFDMYRKGNDREHFQTIWNATRGKKDRSSQDTIICQTGLSIAGGIQPKELVSLFSTSFYDSGFSARFLYCLTESRIKKYKKCKIVDNSYWNSLIDYCYEIELNQSYGEIQPLKLYLSDTAREVFIKFHDEYEEKKPFLSQRG